VANIPVGEATRLSPLAEKQDLPTEVPTPMLRLQTPLPERYREASPDELDAMIGAAK
jgi:hypothetical protein